MCAYSEVLNALNAIASLSGCDAGRQGWEYQGSLEAASKAWNTGDWQLMGPEACE